MNRVVIKVNEDGGSATVVSGVLKDQTFASSVLFTLGGAMQGTKESRKADAARRKLANKSGKKKRR